MDENRPSLASDRIERYMLHDPVGNMEGEIAEFDPEKLARAEAGGAVFIAVRASGAREIVKAADIVEPKPMLNGTVLVEPRYVDERARAVVAVFDALDESMSGGARTRSAEPLDAFHEALEALRALSLGEKGGADADA